MLLGKIYKIIGPNKKLIIFFIILILIFSILFELLSIAMIIPLLGYIFQVQDLQSIFAIIFNSQLLKSLNIDFGILLSLFFFLGILVKNIFLYFAQKILYKNIFLLESQIANRILKNYLYSDYKFFTQNNSSTLTHYITQEIWKLRDVLIACFYMISDLIIIFGITTLLLINNFKITIILLLIILIFSFLIIKVYRKKLENLGNQKLILEKKRLSQVSNIFRLVKEILVKNMHDYFLKRFKKNYEQLVKPSVYQSILRLIPRMWIEIFFSFSVAIFFIIVIYRDINVLNIFAEIVFYIVCLIRLLPTVNRTLHSNQVITFGIPTLQTIENQLDLNNNFELTKKYRENQSQKIDFNKSISLKKINFKYDDNENILNDLNLEVKKNSIIAIVGKSGSGKTTILNILLGLTNDYHGKVLVDGNYEIKQNLIAWQNNIGFIPQTVFISNDTLKNNIAIGVEEKEISLQKLNSAIEKSKVSDFINDLHDKENTLLSEDGKNLSGGQIQRIGIARALYNEPEILILDEPTSALDGIIEKEIFQILKKLNKTIIFVTHNHDNLEICDEIYNLDNKKLSRIR